jgi:hypothetical protein
MVILMIFLSIIIFGVLILSNDNYVNIFSYAQNKENDSKINNIDNLNNHNTISNTDNKSENNLLTIISALIGAVIGSIGSAIITNYLSHWRDSKKIYEQLIQKYLLQLQDCVESLWFRLYNIHIQGEQMSMEDKYYEVTTLYSLARVLALKYIISIEGVYFTIEKEKKGLGLFLRNKLENIDNELNHINQENMPHSKFYRYDRQLLAEVVLEKEDHYNRTCTFLDFRKRYEESNSEVAPLLNSARDFIQKLNKTNVLVIMDYLLDIEKKLELETGIKSNITKSYSNDMNKDGY